ncbi:unnamed protein product [Acanthoscelides obtectus]|uniref:Phospholipid/glycerol acyltransferase domain-containing protein n=1 Tax=Acanthoscelides obtectus TaxID=200917 RepID=A0A9P0NYV8_ACAOB|nr:unnamed protein product [Acanthoscelides obtectus]CAK1649350.1 Acyl-CoA:lysophosphatidylglycerol acyltransferase 1 [Acanthoscelides obtectus]
MWVIQNRWYEIPRGILRLCFILLNNVYCIPTYVIWMLTLWPLRKFNSEVYWKLEGYFFHWLLAMVSLWSYSAGYDIVEVGDDISECLEEKTLIIANHQSTADVPLLFACFNPKKHVLPNIMWIMDSLFKYTNFGVVSVLHKDFFIMSGKTKRDQSLQQLAKHIIDTYIPLKRRWMVLFPEGGFLRKRKAVSQKYAEKMSLPKLENVSLPRVGAMQVIMDTVGPNSAINNNANMTATTGKNSMGSQLSGKKPNSLPQLQYVLDITIGYPNGWPIDLSHIVFGNRQPCQTVIFYRVYNAKEVPHNPETLTQWLYDRWQEKERMLEYFYENGEFSADFACHSYQPPKVVVQDYLRFIILHAFFIASTLTLPLQIIVNIFNFILNGSLIAYSCIA